MFFKKNQYMENKAQTKSQTIYLAYLDDPSPEDYSMTGHVIRAKGKNVHDDIIPIWTDIRYYGRHIPELCSSEGYHYQAGPSKESCLIFTKKNDAVKRLFEDMLCFAKYYKRMSLYEKVDEREYDACWPTVVYHEDAEHENIIHFKDVRHFFSKEDEKYLLEADPFENF